MTNIRRSSFTVATIVALSACLPLSAHAASSCGGASWYALHSKTASGERMNPSLLTAAHKSLRFGTKLKVTNARNGKSGRRAHQRSWSLHPRSRARTFPRAAAQNIGMVRSGHGKVCYEIIG